MKVENFLCCFKVESGGVIIGFLGFVLSSIQLFTHTFILFSLMAVGKFCPQERRDVYGYQDNRGFNIKCSQLTAIPIAIYLVVAICFNILSIVAHFRLIKGVEHIDSSRFHLSIVYYKFWILMKIIFVVIFVILIIFLSFLMILPTFLLLILLLIDIYILAIIETIKYKFNNFPKMTVTYTPQYC